jgi:hypothetical protein
VLLFVLPVELFAAGCAGFFRAAVDIDVCAHPAGAMASPSHTAPFRLSFAAVLQFIPIY